MESNLRTAREVRCRTAADVNYNWLIQVLEMADGGFTIINEADRRAIVVTNTWRGKYLFFEYDAESERMESYGAADEASIAYGFLIGML